MNKADLGIVIKPCCRKCAICKLVRFYVKQLSVYSYFLAFFLPFNVSGRQRNRNDLVKLHSFVRGAVQVMLNTLQQDQAYQRQQKKRQEKQRGNMGKAVFHKSAAMHKIREGNRTRSVILPDTA